MRPTQLSSFWASSSVSSASSSSPWFLSSFGKRVSSVEKQKHHHHCRQHRRHYRHPSEISMKKQTTILKTGLNKFHGMGLTNQWAQVAACTIIHILLRIVIPDRWTPMKHWLNMWNIKLRTWNMKTWKYRKQWCGSGEFFPLLHAVLPLPLPLPPFWI